MQTTETLPTSFRTSKNKNIKELQIFYYLRKNHNRSASLKALPRGRIYVLEDPVTVNTILHTSENDVRLSKELGRKFPFTSF